MADILLLHDFASPIERVFAAFDDHANMGRWLGSRISMPHVAADGGVGTVRRIHGPLGYIDEEIVERTPPSRIVYRIINRVPGVRSHQGEVTLIAAGPEQTRVQWYVRIESHVPGVDQVILRVVRFALARGMRELARQLSA